MTSSNAVTKRRRVTLGHPARAGSIKVYRCRSHKGQASGGGLSFPQSPTFPPVIPDIPPVIPDIFNRESRKGTQRKGFTNRYRIAVTDRLTGGNEQKNITPSKGIDGAMTWLMLRSIRQHALV